MNVASIQRTGCIDRVADECLEPLFPTTRLLRANLFEAELSVEQAHRQVRDARRQADDIVGRAHSDATSIRETARCGGASAGVAEIRELLETMRAVLQQFHAALEQQLCRAALEIARDILDCELSTNRDAVLAFVRRGVERAGLYGRVVISMHPEQYRLLHAGSDNSVAESDSVIVREDERTPRGEFTLETEMGTLHVSAAAALLAADDSLHPAESPPESQAEIKE